MDARLLTLACALAAGAANAQATKLTVRPAGPDVAYGANYSQGLLLDAELDVDGAPLNGPAYGDPPLRITFTLIPDGDAGPSFVIDSTAIDAAGRANVRLTLVDGRYGGQQFAGAGTEPDAGFPYTVRAEFLGRNPPSLGECLAAVDGGPPPDGGLRTQLCASSDDGTLLAALEIPELILDPVGEIALGETKTLVAKLTDPNGDAPLAGSDVDGDGPTDIEGGTISFFYDLDLNGRPSLDERLGTAETNADGIATFDFTADPAFVTAGDYELGLHVQYAGDGRRYSIAGDATRLTVLAGAPDAARTLIDIEPPSLPADGFSVATITVTLVDGAGNILDINAPNADVSLSTTLGTLQGTIERDPLTGYYVQDIKATRQGGTADIVVTVDGVEGTHKDMVFEAEGCTCATTTTSAPLGVVAMVAVALLRRRRA